MTAPPERLKTALADHYAIESELGEGGMAKVYLARDLKHDRNVAIKVLRPELAAILGAERFLNEIKVTANLQHPNILPLYDSGEADSFLYYVMPYLEGESLRDKLDREKQLPVEDTVALAKEVAAALQFAHERGVVHRDIKPENIMLQAGQAIVADFGIALAVSQAGGSRLTETGLSLGTPHYMSPEQATGDREVDARSDVYSLGSMVYEMLVGEPPHVGNSVQAIIAKIITDEPVSITRTRQLVPANIDAAVFKSLAKSPADRFSSARAFAEALSDSSFTLAVGTGPTATASVKNSRPLIAGMAFVSVGLALALGISLTNTVETPIRTYMLAFDEAEAPVTVVAGQRLIISPDGSKIVYVGAHPDGGDQLWLRERDRLHAEPIPGSEGALNPFFSPDGIKIGFFSAGGLKTLTLSGGLPLTLVDTGFGTGGAAWSDDGFIYYDADLGGIRRVPERGGTEETVVPLDTAAGETGFAWPELIPGSKSLLLRVRRRSDLPSDFDIDVADLETGEHHSLMKGLVARFFAPGHILVATFDRGLLAVPFDRDRLTLSGEPIMVGQGLATGTFGSADLDVSPTGTLVYVAGGSGAARWVAVNRVGEERYLPGFGENSGYEVAYMSPDGSKLAFSREGNGGRRDIWVGTIGSGELSKLTFDGRLNIRPRWTGDGNAVTFVSVRNGEASALYSKRIDGSGAAKLVAAIDGREISEGFISSDGRWAILRTSTGGSGDGDIFGLNLETGEEPIPLVATASREVLPALSPDGKWLAYLSNETGTNQIYVRPFPDVDSGRWQVSNEPSGEPVWSHSGNELFFRSGRNYMMARLGPGASFPIVSREILFDGRGYRSGFLSPGYDVTPDDQELLVVSTRASTSGTKIVVLDNLAAELERITGN